MAHDAPLSRKVPAASAAPTPCPDPRDDLIVCHVAALTDADLVMVHLMARVLLLARRQGRQVHFCHAPPALVELISCAGLAAVLDVGSQVEPRRQPEQREQPGRVQERVHGDDLPA